MNSHNSIGLDELMIVNPGRPGLAELVSGKYFLGDYGRLYQVQDFLGEQSDAGLAEYYLGDDGNLYQLKGLQALIQSEDSAAGLAGTRRLPRFFLGEDGTLYEMRKK
jgi:hypothetical protein